MPQASEVEMVRASHFCANLRRVVETKPRGYQAQLARDADITTVHLSRLFTEPNPNPRIGTMEALAVVAEIPLETLMSASPTDADLRIFGKTA